MGTLYAWVHRGQLPVVRLGPRSPRIRRETVLEFEARR